MRVLVKNDSNFNKLTFIPKNWIAKGDIQFQQQNLILVAFFENIMESEILWVDS